MSIKDWDGTTNNEIGKLFDWDGTTNHQIGKVYDNDGTNNRLIYNSVSPENNVIMTNGQPMQPSITGNISTNHSGNWWYHEAGGYTSEQGGARLFRPSGEESGQWGSFWFNNKIDISGYTKLKIQVYGYRGYGDAGKGNCWFGGGLSNDVNKDPDHLTWIWHNGHPLHNWAQNPGDIYDTTYTIDLYGYEGLAYIYIGFVQAANLTYSMFVKNIWLE